MKQFSTTNSSVPKEKSDGIYIELEGTKLLYCDPNSTLEEYNHCHFTEIINELSETNPLFNRCGNCTTQDETLCEALVPLTHIFPIIEQYKSAEPVKIFFRDGEDTYVARSTLQSALETIALICSVRYCTLTKKIPDYYKGFTPCMNSNDAADLIFKNICNIYSKKLT